MQCNSNHTTPTEDDVKQKRLRRVFSFGISLRSLLGLVGVLSILLGVRSHNVHKAREALHYIEEDKRLILMQTTTDYVGPDWISGPVLRWLRIDGDRDPLTVGWIRSVQITEIAITSTEIEEALVERLSAIHTLKQVTIISRDRKLSGAANLARLGSISHLRLIGPWVWTPEFRELVLGCQVQRITITDWRGDSDMSSHPNIAWLSESLPDADIEVAPSAYAYGIELFVKMEDSDNR